MQNPIKECIGKLREEIAQIGEANRQYVHGGKKKLTRRSRGSRTSASKIAGNLGRGVGAHRLEETISESTFSVEEKRGLAAHDFRRPPVAPDCKLA
jgi:hypothetical protein